MKKIIFDIETTAIKPKELWIDRIHFVVWKEHNVDMEPIIDYDVDLWLSRFADNEDIELIGHNIIMFDIPQLQHHFPGHEWNAKFTDTMLLSRICAPMLPITDHIQDKIYPKKLRGSHSLAAWGIRLGNQKGDFKGPWDKPTPEMEEYAKQDIRVTEDVYNILLTSPYYTQHIVEYEHEVHKLFTDDIYIKGVQLKGLEELEQRIQRDFETALEEIKQLGFEGNPNSRQQVAKFLIEHCGWEPKVFTEKTGAPKVSADTLPEDSPFKKYYLIQKPLSMVETLKKETYNDGKLHPVIATCNTRSTRTSSYSPNVQQIPRASDNEDPEKPWLSKYGQEFRALFAAGEGKILVGADLSSLELRMMAHALAQFAHRYEWIEMLEAGKDVHAENARILGLERAEAKSVVFASIYGAGIAKIATMLNCSEQKASEVLRRLRGGIPGYKLTKDKLEMMAKRHGYVVLPHNRRVNVDEGYKAFNTYLQSLGSECAKKWCLTTMKKLDKGKARLVLYVHDEVLIECEPEYAPYIQKTLEETLLEVKDDLGLLINLECESKIGETWRDVH